MKMPPEEDLVPRAEGELKIVLLALHDHAPHARSALLERFPQALIEDLPRSEVESGPMRQRLAALRARKPDIFAIATDRISCQRGQNALLLFGALAGARKSIVLDIHGDWREEGRGRLLASAPARLTREAAISAMALAHSARQLRRLEKALDRNDSLKRAAPVHKSRTGTGLRVTYLRATLSAATQGGASSHLIGVVKGLSAEGAQVSLISNDTIAGLDHEEIPLRVITPRPLGSTRAAFDIYNNLIFTRAALRLIEADPPDFIYQRYSRFSWAGVEAALKTGRPLFLEYNGSEVWMGRHWDATGHLGLLARYERLNLQAAARIFIVSDVQRQELRREGVPEEKIILNPNGVDPELFRPQQGGERVRRAMGIADDETLVGFVGSFGPWHGVEVLAEAITRLPETARIKFMLIGAGGLRSQIEAQLRTAGVEQRVIFMGRVEHDRVPALLDACDVLASPHVPLSANTEFFGSPTKLFEYMAMGKGIVASRLGQIAEVLKDEETALLVEPGDAAGLAAAVLRLAESKELRERLGAAARAAAVERHTWRQNAARVLAAYQELA